MKSAAANLAAERELQVLLHELDQSGVRPLILKGVGLAYSVYRSPALRVWGDIDLLFRGEDVASAVRVLKTRGYAGPDIDVNRVATYECTYSRSDRAGNAYSVDIHWKVNNAQLLARAIDFSELWAASIPLPRLSPFARTLGAVHAFVLACVHRVGHFHAPFYVDGEPRYAGDHLRWLFDIHLLAEALNAAQFRGVVELVISHRLAFACWDSVSAAREAFGTLVPDEVMASLRSASRRQGRMGAESHLAWMLANWRALPTLRDRTSLLKEVLFPPATHVRQKYNVGSRAGLPLWYAHRAVRGFLAAVRAPRRGKR